MRRSNKNAIDLKADQLSAIDVAVAEARPSGRARHVRARDQKLNAVLLSAISDS